MSIDRNVKLVIEQHPDGFVGYALGVQGAVIGEGGTFDEALADLKSALKFHIETFGDTALDLESPVIEAFIVDAAVSV